MGDINVKLNQLLFTLNANTVIELYNSDGLLLKGKLKSLDVISKHGHKIVKHVNVTESAILEIIL